MTNNLSLRKTKKLKLNIKRSLTRLTAWAKVVPSMKKNPADLFLPLACGHFDVVMPRLHFHDITIVCALSEMNRVILIYLL